MFLAPSNKAAAIIKQDNFIKENDSVQEKELPIIISKDTVQ